MLEKFDHSHQAVIVGILRKGDTVQGLNLSLDELERLLDTLGYEVVARLIQYKEVKTAKYKIGKGKVEELHALLESSGAKLVVFDEDLSPTQARNLQEKLKLDITDRCGVILDIFSDHARTHEAKLQVQLAKLEYGLSRLKRQWTHLHRQKGGHGLRGGEGETQLEVDRRMARKSMQVIREKLKKIQQQREVQKRGRARFFKVAIVGYTNSGKSTLLNRMCEAEVLVQDKLFATLDPTTRIIKPEEKPSILFSDTVGFIKKLPHQLVASFRSTFEQIQDADLLLHVVDVSDPEFKERIKDTQVVLKDLELDSIPRQLVLNKIDKIPKNSLQLKLTQSVYPEAILISARDDLGIEDLKNKIYSRFEDQLSEKTIEVSLGCESILEEIYELTKVVHSHYENDRIVMSFRGATRDINHLVDLLAKNNALLECRDGLVE